ncbi:hypothetical protein HOY80DRAFT_1002086 [Tuber brumale]|nr:hypothetical protein HOY80DRAFT_1002086 [Tuber brumale]
MAVTAVVVQVVVDRATAVATAVAVVNEVAVRIMEAMVNVVGVESGYLKVGLKRLRFPAAVGSGGSTISTLDDRSRYTTAVQTITAYEIWQPTNKTSSQTF